MDWLFVFSQAFTYGHIKGEREREREYRTCSRWEGESIWNLFKTGKREKERERKRERERENTPPKKWFGIKKRG